MAATTPAKQFVHYIIVVHGIGEQRKNETVLPVISQFAAVRHNKPNHDEMLTLGLLASQSTDTNWIELDGIPSTPDPKLDGKSWQPQAAANPEGENFRFLDFVWSDVTREQHPQVGQSVKDWSNALINRLEQRESLGVKGVSWIIYLLKNMQEGLLMIQRVLNIRDQSVSNRIFNDFLGDVELYGDFPNSRGRAVRLFHERMAELHELHINEFSNIDNPPDPRYTIIAHSLGTVMTLDAITYAHANQESRDSNEISSNQSIVHFPGYDGAEFSHEHSIPERIKDLKTKPRPSVFWVKYLDSYVTLGSPIDKYLALWTENYRHFTNTDWLDQNFVTQQSPKIRHFNYSDEQDPVGHELNILRTTPVWQALMEMGEDIVFARYPIPGLAHMGYWKDYDLFHRILDLAIDKRDQPLESGKKPQGHYVEWFDTNAFAKALFFSFVAVPVLGWLAGTFFLEKFIQGIDSGSFSLLTLLIFAGTLWLTHKVMKLIIMWRLLLVVSRQENSPMREKKNRKIADKVVRSLIYGTPILWGVLLLLTLTYHESFGGFLQTWNVSLILAFLVSYDIARIFYSTHKHWDDKLKKTLAKNFSEYV